MHPKRYSTQIKRGDWIILTETSHPEYFMIVYVRLINGCIFSLIGEYPEDLQDNNVYIKLYAFKNDYEYVLYDKEICPHDYWGSKEIDQTKVLRIYTDTMDEWLAKSDDELWSLIMEADL